MEAIIGDTKTQKMLDVWFENLIGKLRADRTEINCGIASPEKESFYKTLVTQPAEEIINGNRKVINMQFIEQALSLYNKKLNEYKNKPIKVALNLADAKVYVFAVINNDDELAEDALLLTEAFVNAEFEQYGVHLTTTILEKEDSYSIPEHYKTYIG